MRVAAVAAVLSLSVAGYADDASEANPDSRALLEYVKKLEARVDQLESEKQWPLDQIRGQSGSALENAVRSINLSGYMEVQYGFNLRHGGRGDGSTAAGTGFFPGTGGTGGGEETGKKAFEAVAARGDTLNYNQLAGTSGDDNGFSFQNLQLLVDKPLTTKNSTGFRISPQFGLVSRFGNRDGSFTDTGHAFDVREANFSWRTSCPIGSMDQVDITVGKMATPLSFETPDNNHANNWLVTRNNIHNFATPNNHTGLRVTLPWGECQKTMLYVVNGWDNVRDAGDGKTFMFSHEMGKFDFMNSSLIINGSYGNEGGGFYPKTRRDGFTPATAPDGNKVKLIEAIWQGEIDDRNKVALDALASTADKGAIDAAGDAEQAETQAVSAYLRHQLSKTTYLAARAGYFATTSAGVKNLRVYDISIAMGWDLTEDLSLAVEYRHDHSPTTEPFHGKHGGSFVSDQDRLTASMVFEF